MKISSNGKWSVGVSHIGDKYGCDVWIESAPTDNPPTRFNTQVEFILEDIGQLRSFAFFLARIENWQEFEDLREAALDAVDYVRINELE